ncbi:MAG TPA: DUF222 domain-containing protein [Pseudonocardiaceae bacterium]|nr:DUF222 domain-containing protein [Pseudonocardiaceae bacterium]
MIRSVMMRIPTHIDTQQRVQVEAELARQARILDASQLAVLGRRMLAYLDQDGRPPKDQPEARRHLRWHDRDGGYELSGWLDREAAEILRSALSPLAAPRPTTDVEVDLRTAAQRDADALVDLAQRALDSGELPTEGGQCPACCRHSQLARAPGPHRLRIDGARWPDQRRDRTPHRLRRRNHPGGAGLRGEPLDVGRASRIVPAAIRRSVILRDGGCAFPGCAVPARWCDIHHVVHWAQGGATRLTNCVALCGRHHRLLHHSDWRIDMTGGIPQFHPPPWLGGSPRRNPVHAVPALIRIRE